MKNENMRIILFVIKLTNLKTLVYDIMEKTFIAPESSVGFLLWSKKLINSETGTYFLCSQSLKLVLLLYKETFP